MNNTIVIVGILVIAAAGGYLFLNRDAGELILEDEAVPSDVLANTQLFMERRAVLDSITLDTAVLSDTRFTSLRSYTSPVAPRPVGRPNPFAPVSSSR
jgi:hypothetical protein